MDSLPNYQEFLDCAVAAANTAGNYALKNANRRTEIFQRSAHDVKLKLDMECQQQAEQVIRGAFPGHRILGEESGEMSLDAEFLWIIDPIDGTVNFSHGMPWWCCSVALQHRGEVVAGAVYLPVLNQLYTATRVHPALCNNEPIRVSETESLDHSLILSGLSKSHDDQPLSIRVFSRIALKAQKTRQLGAAAADICLVAAGRADAYFETGIYLWDVAAAGLIAQRAGAQFEVIEKLSDVRLRILCTNGRIHQPLKELVLSALASSLTKS